MRKILIIIFALTLLLSCTSLEDLYEPYKEYRYSVPDVSFNNIQSIKDYVMTNITYKKDIDVHGHPEYFQTPEQTMQLRSGDCEDFHILMMVLIYTYLNKKGQLICVTNDKVSHISLYLNGIIVDYSTTYESIDKYKQVMRMVFNSPIRIYKMIDYEVALFKAFNYPTTPVVEDQQ